MWSLPDRSPWRGILVTVAMLAATPAVRAQPNDTWTGASTNSPANLWTDGTNWSTSAQPTSAQTAYFSTSAPNMTVSLQGQTVNLGILAFDTASVPSYIIGSSVGDGTLSIANPYSGSISNGGAIAVTQTVTTTQTINSNISLVAGAYITNYGTTLNLNGTITIGGGSTTNIRTDLSGFSTQASTTNLAGNLAIPSTTGTLLRLEENSGNTSTSPAGTLIGTGVISGGLAGSGTTSAYSVIVVGAGQATAASGGNPSTISVGTYQPNPNNTYSGGTNLNGVDTLIPITGSGSGNSVNADGTTNITSGPFGTGSIFLTTFFPARLQPATGSNNVIYNAIVENGNAGNPVFNMTSSAANDTTSSLTLAGPISNPTGNQYYMVNGTTVNSITDETLASPVFGATMILGLAATPSTITLSSTSGVKSNFNAISGPIVINDAIQSANSQTVILNNNSFSNTSTYSIRLNSANSTYQGSTFLANGAFANMGAILVGASTNTSSNATFSSGPFGVSAIIPANNNSPFLVPVGGDQTLANALGIGSTSVTGNASGFTVANYWINTINLGSAAGGYPQGVSSIINTDSGSYHNLTFTGPITVGSSQVITNNMASGVALTLGLSGANASTISLGANTLTFQTNPLPNLPAGYVVGGLTVVNDQVTGAGGLTVIGGMVVLNASNSYSGGTNVLSGTVQVAADADLGTGNVTGATLGTLSFTGSTATTKSFAMNGGTIAVAAGQTVTFNGNQITSATLDGNGTFATNGVVFDNGTTTSSVAITSTSASDRFIHVVNNAALTFAGGLNPSVSTAVANLNGFTNEGSGSVTIGAGSAINAANFQSYGTLTLVPNTTSAPTVFTNTGTATLGFNGGSRTFIGTPGTADPTGQNIVAYVDLHGHNAVVADGLFVNNGGIFDTVGAGSSTIIADFGSLVKGAGFYQNTVKTQNGGKFQTGNSPGSATFGNFVFGPGGVSNYIFAIDDATGVAGPSPGSSGLVSGWGLIKAVQVSLATGTTSGNFTWTATPTNPLSVAIDTLVNPTMVGTDVAGPMADFDPTQAYSWTAAHWTGTYAGPTDVATLDADTSFNTTGFANPIAGTFGWSLDPAGQTLSLVYTPSAVPEPGTLALVGLAAAAGWWRRRRATPSA